MNTCASHANENQMQES